MGIDAELQFHQVAVGFGDLVAEILLGAIGGFDMFVELFDLVGHFAELAFDAAEQGERVGVEGRGGGDLTGCRSDGGIALRLAGEESCLFQAIGEAEAVAEDGSAHEGEGEDASGRQDDGFHRLSGLGKDSRS